MTSLRGEFSTLVIADWVIKLHPVFIGSALTWVCIHMSLSVSARGCRCLLVADNADQDKVYQYIEVLACCQSWPCLIRSFAGVAPTCPIFTTLTCLHCRMYVKYITFFSTRIKLICVGFLKKWSHRTELLLIIVHITF